LNKAFNSRRIASVRVFSLSKFEISRPGCIRPSKVSFKNLTHIHTAGHTKRIEHNLDRRSIFEVRHILLRQNACDDALVT